MSKQVFLQRLCEEKSDCPLDLKSLGIQIPVPAVSSGETTISAVQQPPALKSLVEPLPASALKGLIKIEPNSGGFNPNIVKVEDECQDYGLPVFSPMSSLASPGSPMSPSSSGGGGKMKTPTRKKSTASTDEEDDLSSIPSLQMRIHLIQQRVSGPSHSLAHY